MNSRAAAIFGANALILSGGAIVVRTLLCLEQNIVSSPQASHQFKIISLITGIAVQSLLNASRIRAPISWHQIAAVFLVTCPGPILLFYGHFGRSTESPRLHEVGRMISLVFFGALSTRLPNRIYLPLSLSIFLCTALENG